MYIPPLQWEGGSSFVANNSEKRSFFPIYIFEQITTANNNVEKYHVPLLFVTKYETFFHRNGSNMKHKKKKKKTQQRELEI